MNIQRYNVFRMGNGLRDKAINAVGQFLTPVKSDEGEIVFYKDHLAAMKEQEGRILRFAKWWKCNGHYALSENEAFQYWKDNVENMK